MRVKKLKFKKEIVANISDAESDQIRGGTNTFTAGGTGSMCAPSVASCFCSEYLTTLGNTDCCGWTYSRCC